MYIEDQADISIFYAIILGWIKVESNAITIHYLEPSFLNCIS